MPASDSPRQPTWGWMWRSPVRILALGLGSGLLRPAPGTWGTAMGWVLWLLILSRLPDVAVAAILLVSYLLGCIVCQHVGGELDQPDAGSMVWDEIVAFWLVLWLVPAGFVAQAVAFVLFRVFDIAKPPPIRYFDRRWKNGFGVMWDDLLAAAYALLVMAIAVKLELLS